MAAADEATGTAFKEEEKEKGTDLHQKEQSFSENNSVILFTSHRR